MTKQLHQPSVSSHISNLNNIDSMQELRNYVEILKNEKGKNSNIRLVSDVPAVYTKKNNGSKR